MQLEPADVDLLLALVTLDLPDGTRKATIHCFELLNNRDE